jgi:hypothetical protein
MSVKRFITLAPDSIPATGGTKLFFGVIYAAVGVASVETYGNTPIGPKLRRKCLVALATVGIDTGGNLITYLRSLFVLFSL